jgi:hypothetical protein
VAPRQDPKEHGRLRKALADAEAELQGQEVVPAMMPLGPGDMRSIFAALKAFRSKFPTQAGALIERVGKMLGATEEEMAAGMRVRPRNDWKPNLEPQGGVSRPLKPEGSGGVLADVGSKIDRPVDVGRTLRRVPPEDLYQETRGKVPGLEPVRPPQSPNARRAEQAAAKAAEKVVTTVEAAVKKATKR